MALRTVRNFGEGHGLVYQTGERVQTFSSPIAILVLLAFNALTGGNENATLWLFRLLSIGALSGTLVLMARVLSARACPPFAMVLALGLVLFDAKTLAFSVAGMETAFFLYFLLRTIALLFDEESGERDAIPLTLSLSGLLFARPDAAVYLLGLGMAYWVFLSPGGVPPRSRFALQLKACTGAAWLYLPWIAWSWWYYGSPIPQSVVAKSLDRVLLPLDLLQRLILFPLEIAMGGTTVEQTFAPPYFWFGGWPRALTLAGSLGARVAALYWLVPRGSILARRVSLAFFVVHFYLSAVALPYPWYLPPAALMGALILGGVAADARTLAGAWSGWRLRWGRRARVVVGSVGLGAALSFIAAFGAAAFQLRVQQREIEEGTRKPVGLWLKQAARSTDESVFLEPLGYVGFYSGLRMLDYPGIATPAMTDARRRVGSRWPRLIRELKPDWLVLRDIETLSIAGTDPDLLRADYRVAHVFDSRPALARYRWLPGRQWLDFDSRFIVFRRVR